MNSCSAKQNNPEKGTWRFLNSHRSYQPQNLHNNKQHNSDQNYDRLGRIGG